MPDLRTLHGVSDLREFFRTNETPIYFFSPTPFNLLGIDRWVRNFYYVSYYDTFDGVHPRMFVPKKREAREFGSMAEVCNYLLGHHEVLDWIHSHGPTGEALFVMFDEETEALAAAAGLQVALPSAQMRHHIDSKVVTTRIGNDAGVPSVPNVLGQVVDYAGLLDLAARAGLGTDLVVQLPYGDSGKTTYFITCQHDWDESSRHETLAGEELKVMKRIHHRALAVEAVQVRQGTLVGPLMNDITGHPELTPYRGGWAGNDYPATLSTEHKALAREYTCLLGARLAKEGYRGFFEVDFLADLDTGELYLGEINPRISGISPMTNVTAGVYADMPLILFHLLEFLHPDFEIDVDEINRRWAREATVDVWSQVLLKEVDDEVELLTHAPRTGIYGMDADGIVSFRRWANDWYGINDESEAFFLRILGSGDYRYQGCDLGALVTRGQLQGDDNVLAKRCGQWVAGIRSQFAGTPPVDLDGPPVLPPFKMG